MKLLKTIGIWVLVIIAGLFVFRNVLAKTAFVYGLELLSPFNVELKKINIDVVGTRLAIEGLEIQNPKDFNERVFCSLPRMDIDFDLAGFIQKKVLAFNVIEFNLEKAVIAKNAQGVSNLELLPFVSQAKEAKKEPKEVKEEPKKKAGGLPKIFIKRCVLTMREVGFVDESRDLAQRQVVDLRVDNEVFENLDDINVIVGIVLWKILQNNTLGRLPIGIEVGDIGQNVQDVAAQGVQMATDAMNKGVEASKVLVDSVSSEAVAQLGGTVDEASKALSAGGKEVVGKLGSATDSLKKGVLGVFNKATEEAK